MFVFKYLFCLYLLETFFLWDLQERHGTLTEKYSDQTIKDSEDFGSENGISLDKSLSAALDSFDNLFCRRCLVFSL